MTWPHCQKTLLLHFDHSNEKWRPRPHHYGPYTQTHTYPSTLASTGGVPNYLITCTQFSWQRGSHRRQVLSMEPETSRDPSKLKLTLETSPVWPISDVSLLWGGGAVSGRVINNLQLEQLPACCHIPQREGVVTRSCHQLVSRVVILHAHHLCSMTLETQTDKQTEREGTLWRNWETKPSCCHL